MRTDNHTPGPWKLEPDPDYRVNGREVWNRVVADEWLDRKFVCKVHGGSSDEANANANLIAAAPEMYMALRAYEALDAQRANCDECSEHQETAPWPRKPSG